MKLRPAGLLGTPADPFLRMAFTPDGARLVVVGGESGKPGRIWVWDVRKEALETVVETGEVAVATVAIAPGGQRLAVAGCVTDTVEIRALSDLALVARLKILTPPYERTPAGLLMTSTHVVEAAFSPDGAHLALACWDCTLKLLDLESGDCTLVGQRLRHNVDLAAWLPATGQLVFGTYRTLWHWDLGAGSPIAVLDLGREEAWLHALLADGTAVVSVSRDAREGLLHVWTLSDHSRTTYPLTRKPPIQSLAVSPAHRFVAITQQDGRVVFWDTTTGAHAATLRASKPGATQAVCAPDRPILAVLSQEPDIRLALFEILDS